MSLVNHTLSKAMLLVSIALFFFSICRSQTFSKRANFDLVSVYLHVVNQPYGYQVMGRAYDTTDAPLHLITFVRNFDFEGNELETKIYDFPNGRHLNPNYDVNARLNDSTTVYVVLDTEANNDTVYNTVVWLHNNGDTLKTKRFHSPYHGQGTESFLPTAMTLSSDGQFMYFVTMVQPQPLQNNFIIKKLTAEGDEVWTYMNPVNFWYFSCYTIAYFENQVWFVAIASGEQNNYNRLMRLNDETGVPDYDVEHNAISHPIGGVSDMVIDSEGYTVAGAEGTVNNIVPNMFKVDFEGNYVWH